MASLPFARGPDRIAGLDAWRGVLVLVVLAAHFLSFNLPGLGSRFYAPLQPLTRAGGSATAAAVILPDVAAGREAQEVAGFALDPQARQGTGVAEVLVTFGDGEPKAARTGLPTPGLAHVMPGFAHAGWAVPLDDAAWRRGEAVPVTLLVRRADGAEVTFAGSVRYLGGGPRWQRVQWPSVLGQAAVDHFFVISGFLITLVLLRTERSRGYLRTFWARRAARILPLAWLLVAIAWFAYPAGRELLPSYLLFYNNYVHQSVPGLAPMWSLMVEEHFYLVYPVLCLLVPRRWLWLAVGGLCLGFAALRLHLPTYYVDGLVIAVPMTHLRAVALALGCWVALVHAGLVPRARVCAWVFAAWVALWAAFGGSEPLFARYGRLGLLDPVSLGGAALLLVWLTSRSRNGPRWLRFVGVRCYGIYLLHVPLLMLFKKLAPSLPLGWFFALWLPSVVAVAALSFRWLESPLRALAPGGGPATSRDRSSSNPSSQPSTEGAAPHFAGGA